jgi:hypothetical protein
LQNIPNTADTFDKPSNKADIFIRSSRPTRNRHSSFHQPTRSITDQAHRNGRDNFFHVKLIGQNSALGTHTQANQRIQTHNSLYVSLASRINADTLLPVDKKELKKHYDTLLKDFPAGTIDKAGFSSLFPDGSMADYWFDVFDNDGNGTMDLKEYFCAQSILLKGSIDERLECKHPYCRFVLCTY